MSLLSPVLGAYNPETATHGSTLSDTVIGVKSQPSSESDGEQQGFYEPDEEDKEEDETPVPEDLGEEKYFDEAPHTDEPQDEPQSPTITISVDNKSPTAQFFRQPSDSGGSPSSRPKPGTVPVPRPISPIPGMSFQPIKIVAASSSPSPKLTATPPLLTSAVSPVPTSSPRLSLQPVNTARSTSPAVSTGYHPGYPVEIQPGVMQQSPYYPPGSSGTYSEAPSPGFPGSATSPYRTPSPVPPSYGQQGPFHPNPMYPPVSNYNFPPSITAPMQMPTPTAVPSVPRNTPVSGFHRPLDDDHGLNMEELRMALQNDLEPQELGNRVHEMSSGHSTPSQGSRTGFSSQSSSATGSPYADRKTSWPASSTRSHHPPYPMNRSVSSPERKYSGEKEYPLPRRPELGKLRGHSKCLDVL